MGNCCQKKKKNGAEERVKILDEMQEQMIDPDKQNDMESQHDNRQADSSEIRLEDLETTESAKRKLEANQLYQ